MDFPSSQPGSPGTPTPLQPVSHNQQRDSAHSSLRSDASPTRDKSVHDKINQFNSLTTQSKQLERKTADAALKRAMVAREQAENEMRQYRDEARALRRHAEEGKMREQKVGERLEAVMVRLPSLSPFQLLQMYRNMRTGGMHMGNPNLLADMRRLLTRRTTPVRKRHMPIPRRSGRKRSVVRGKKPSNRRVLWSSCKKN